jgi:hypothetical protein
MDRLRSYEAILALNQECADMQERLRRLDRGGAERRRDAIRFEASDDLAHGMARWIARLDAHFVARRSQKRTAYPLGVGWRSCAINYVAKRDSTAG